MRGTVRGWLCVNRAECCLPAVVSRWRSLPLSIYSLLHSHCLLALSSRSFSSLATLYASYYDTLYASLALLTRHFLTAFLTLFQHVLLSAAGNATAVPRLSSF